LLCDGLDIVFYPVQAEKTSGGAEQVTLIELTIEKKKKKTAANIKRTPFEEENYIASAWSRPPMVPFSLGPRSLRVLGPLPQLVVTNLTEPLTKGKALEGTVNRVLLKLKAGADERCSNIKLSVSCFSVLITPSGSTKRLVSEEDLVEEAENSMDMKNPLFRTPILVSASSSSISNGSVSTDFGYDLPAGWRVSGSGQKDATKNLEPLKEGESSFVTVDFFRPAAHTQKKFHATEADISDEDLGDLSTCKTDFYVTLTYDKDSPSGPKQKMRRRAVRQRPVMSASKSDAAGNGGADGANTETSGTTDESSSETSKEVSLEYTGSIVWASPIFASFTSGARRVYPSGNRHPANGAEGDGDDNDECVLVDGESVSTRCRIQLDPSMEGLSTELASVRFEVSYDDHKVS